MTGKRIKSIIDEITAIVPAKNVHAVVEARSQHVISAAIHLLEMIEQHFSAEDYEKLEKRLLLSIRTREPVKFSNSVRMLRESKGK